MSYNINFRSYFPLSALSFFAQKEQKKDAAAIGAKTRNSI